MRLGSLLLVTALMLAEGLQAGVTVTDAAGRTISLEHPAERVVSLAPSVTELLFAIGAGEHVVGTVNHSDHPPVAERIPQVGGYNNLDLETILALEPDLVIAWASGNPEHQVDQLIALGIPVFISEPRAVGDIPALMEGLGDLTGHGEHAATQAADFRARLAELRNQYGDRAAVRTFYQIWHQPLMTIGRRQHIHDLITLCGGDNVFGDLDTLTATVDREAVLARDPEAIFASGMGDERPEWLMEWERWSDITAVERDHLFAIPPSLIQRSGPRILEGASRLCEALDEVRRNERR